MAAKEYKVTSPEGAEWSGVEEGVTYLADLDHATERAVVAAGWLAPVEPKTKGK